MKKHIYLFLYFSVMTISLFAQSTTDINKEKIIKILPQNIQFLEDKTNQLTISEITSQKDNFKNISSNKINFAYTKSSVWLKFQLKNPYFPEINDFILDFGIPTLDYIDFYYFDFVQEKWITIKTGDRINFVNRPIKTRQLLTFLYFYHHNPHTYYIRLTSDASVQADLQIGRKGVIFLQMLSVEMCYAFFYGMLGVMFFYNLFLFLTLKDLSYFWYLMTVLGTILFISSLVGHLGVFILYENAFLNNQMTPVASGFLTFSSCIFIYFFLNVKKYSKISVYLVYFLATISGLFVIIPFILGSNAGKMILYTNVMGLISLVVDVTIAILCLRQGNPVAKFYLFAFSFYIFGVFILITRNAGVFPINFFTQYAAEFGATLEMLFLSFALSDKYSRFRKEKENAIQQTLQIQKESNENLEKKVQQRTLQLSEANNELGELNEELSFTLEQSEIHQKELRKKNEDIIASINYASRIQNAMLPTYTELDKILGEDKYFIFNKPRDIVSGDFYWLNDNENYTILVVADCTGHGVPGALMSMIGINFLEEIVRDKNITSPDLILNNLHKSIRTALKQKESVNRDGMDIAVVCVDKKEKNISFAGAKNPIFVIFNNELLHLKSDTMPIGGEQREIERIFNKNIFIENINQNMEIYLYLFSDGFQDQFGGKNGKKIMIKNMKEFIFENHTLPLSVQKQKINDFFEDWKGKESQTDDVLILGTKISLK